MRLSISGSLGDEVALTGVLREVHRFHPEERIELSGVRWPEVFAGNPHLGIGEEEKLGSFELGLDPNPYAGTLAHAYGQVLGIPILDPTPELFLSDDELGAGKLLVDQYRSGPMVGVDPWAGWPRRRWLSAKWNELGRELRAQGFTVFELGASTPDCQGRRRPGDLFEESHVRLVNKLSVRETAAAIAALDVYVGSDSGLAHIAAAVGTPHVVLYAVPWWSRAYRGTVPVSPPGGSALDWREHHGSTVEAIEVGTVLQAINLAVSRGRRARSAKQGDREARAA